MIDSTVSTSRVISGVLWAVVISLGIAGIWHWASLVGLTCCATSAAAATANIRCYAIRLCAHIQAIRQATAVPAHVPVPRVAQDDDEAVRHLY